MDSISKSRLQWRWQEPADQASDQTLPLHLDNLELRFETIDKDALQSEKAKKTYEDIAAAFARRRAPPGPSRGDPLRWDDTFRLESRIGCLLRGDRLRQEIASRLRWAISDNVAQAIALQNTYAELLKTNDSKPADELLRDFLLELMEAIHWHSKRKHMSRKMRGQATRRTLLIGLLALLVALWPYFVLPSTVQINPRQASLWFLRIADSAVTEPSSGNDFWIHFTLYTGLTFGFLGALFSRLITLQTQWSAMALDELSNARSYHYIVLRASIGILGALVVYFFLQSGLVEGSVFPKFKELSMNTLSFGDSAAPRWPTRLTLPSLNLALLIMWSFIAGFSESLVPTVLSNTERQFAGATRPRS